MGLREKNTIIAQKALTAIAGPTESRVIDLAGNWTENGKPIIKNGPLYRYHYGIRAQIGGLVNSKDTESNIKVEILTSDTAGFEASTTLATYTFAGKDLINKADFEVFRTEVPQNAKRYIKGKVSGANFTNSEGAVFLAEFIPMPLV